MQTCISDVKIWMTQNKLTLNDDKAEAFLIKSDRTTFPNTQPTSLRLDSADSPFTTCARNLGFVISDNVSRQAHLKRLSFCLRGYQTTQLYPPVPDCWSNQNSRLACVLSKLDYCNSLLSGCPLYILRRLQKVQNSEVKLVFKLRRRDHVQSLF